MIYVAKLVLPVIFFAHDIVTCRGCCVTYKTGFGVHDWIY
jgi:hypothetical protein